MFSRKLTRLAITAGLLVALLGCGKSVQPLEQVVFTQEPLKQIQMNVATFKQLPGDDLKILLAYLGANEKASLEKKQHSEIAGKSIAEVMQEAKTWQVGMVSFLVKSKEMSDSLAKMVQVIPAIKQADDNESVAGKSQILRISYQLSNKTDHAVTGVAGFIKYFWPDGRVAATIPLTFDGRIGPGEVINMFGHQPILVGSRASKEMVAFANAPLTALRFEVTTQAIRFDSGEIINVPTL